jgi:hypothetical protein
VICGAHEGEPLGKSRTTKLSEGPQRSARDDGDQRGTTEISEGRRRSARDDDRAGEASAGWDPTLHLVPPSFAVPSYYPRLQGGRLQKRRVTTGRQRENYTENEGAALFLRVGTSSVGILARRSEDVADVEAREALVRAVAGRENQAQIRRGPLGKGNGECVVKRSSQNKPSRVS